MTTTGARKILSYNRRLYLTSSGLAVAALLCGRGLFVIGASLVLLWLFGSVLVSHYVYDRSPLYQGAWIARCLSHAPRRWLYLHAGLDEFSHCLPELFPSSAGEVLDIYDSAAMTEPSIAEARRIARADVRATPADRRALPLAGGSVDAAFLIFTAHELRTGQARAQLFRELSRVLHSGGEAVLLEHLRDWKNFLAFGPGFLHFYSAGMWRQTAEAAGLSVRAESSMTPFVRLFILRRAA